MKKRGVVTYKRGSVVALDVLRRSGCKLYVRRLTPEESMCIFEGDATKILLTKLRLLMAEFEAFHERRCFERMMKS